MPILDKIVAKVRHVGESTSAEQVVDVHPNVQICGVKVCEAISL